MANGGGLLSSLEQPPSQLHVDAAVPANGNGTHVEERAALPDAGRRFARAPGASGQHLVQAFKVFERFPALGHTRDKLLRLLHEPELDRVAIVSAIESDASLAIAVLRAAHGTQSRRQPASIPAAVATLSCEQLRDAVATVPVFGFFQEKDALRALAEQHRLHAVATQLLAEQIRRQSGGSNGDELALAALLHDIGKVPLLYAYERYAELTRLPATPEQRLALERRYTGIDHATVGGVLARRVGLPDRVAGMIERHHSDQAVGDAAVLRLADMLAHYSAGEPVDKNALLGSARAVGLSAGEVDSMLARLPGAAHARIPRVRPSPLSDRQTEVLRLLAQGKLYKEIGQELGLSTSTIRTHLHSAYTALEVPDRAQAVLRATEQGWL